MRETLSSLFIGRLPGLLLRSLAYLAVGTALMIYINFTTIQEYFKARDRRDAYRESVALLQAEYNNLKAEQVALSANGFAKEKAIRERLLMVRPGEQILFIDEPADPAQTPAPKAD